ncbi:MAG TPA: HAD family phosphatase [Isosphaeraceae bacterium]|jgi:HAD superfamily hydrolase (TIGR01509 family)|nr:HAD family phosphatase [Isosphaeraceae bacterium]
MHPRVILFDFDGVLADTENVHVAAWERTFDAMGFDVAPEVCARAMEEDDRIFLATLFAHRGLVGGDVDGWVRRKQALTARMLADAPQLYPGVVEVVRSLAARDGLRLGVVTTTWRENVAVVLGVAGLVDDFAVVVAKEDVAAVKPDPESYRLALTRLGVGPEVAVALEDSPTGLAAARAAGLRALAVGHRRPPGDWAGDSTYLPDLSDLENVLGAE